MSNPKFYILTEGRNGSLIITSLMKGVDNYEILAANGLSSMLSKAATILKTKNSYVVLFADTDSVDNSVNRSKDKFIKEILNYQFYKSRLKIILASPELEVALFNDKKFFEGYFSTSITEVQWSQMRNAPKQYLHFFFNTNSDEIYNIIYKDPAWEKELYKSEMRKELIRYYREKTMDNRRS